MVEGGGERDVLSRRHGVAKINERKKIENFGHVSPRPTRGSKDLFISHRIQAALMKDPSTTDSILRPRNQIAEIQTEYSQIVRVLAKPLPQPSDSLDTGERKRLSEERQQQLDERERFIRRYQVAIKAFLGKKLGNNQRVEEVWDFFLQKFLEGRMSKYDPDTGSFRTYLKTVLRRTCYEYARKNADIDGGLQMDSVMAANLEANDEIADQAFNRKLVDSIFKRALAAIERIDSLYFVTLKLITGAIAQDIKPPNSMELASILSAESGKAISRDNARTIKSRATKQFARQIILEVSELITTSDLNEVENALIDIGILKYCKKALAKMKEKESKAREQ